MKSTTGTTGVALALVLGTLGLSGCGHGVTAPAATGRSDGPSAAAPVVVTACGQQVTYPDRPERVVALSWGQADLVGRLGAGRRLVGVAQTAGRPLPASVDAAPGAVPVLNATMPPAREQLLAVRPDLVLAPTSFELTAEKGFASQDQLATAGAKTYVAAAGCRDHRADAKVVDVLADIEALGRVLRAEPAARTLAGDVRRRLEAVRARATGAAPSVAQVYVEGDTLSAVGAGLEADLVTVAGGRNAFSPDDPAFASFVAAEVSKETLIAKKPQVIAYTVEDDSHASRSRAWIEKNLAATPAVRDGRLVAIPSSQKMPGSLLILDALETLSKALHPAG